MFNNALSVMPTRPIRFIVPIIVVVVLSLYYWGQYTKCSNIKQFRSDFNESVRSSSQSESFHLVGFTNFVWDKVRIAVNIKPGERNVECPFGWNWEKGERKSLMSSGLLTVLMFGHGESIVGYAELRSDEINFLGIESSLTPGSAKFSIEENSSGKGVTLTLNQ
ncbi:MAG: hypothetical protein ACI8P9_005828 [Parasphingorhabdus sp.]|jgi:hypothetical protein